MVALDRIEHVVVLMMENRSFDHLLGYLRVKQGRAIDGLTGRETNPGSNGPETVRPLRSTRFEFDPGHGSRDVQQQLAGGNQGFVANYIAQGPDQHGLPGLVMGYHDDQQVWAYDSLARQFAVCDHWHAPVPGPTIPNRMFAVTGSSDGDLDNVKPIKFYSMRSVFEALDAGLKDRQREERWGSYYHDMPMLALLTQHIGEIGLGPLLNGIDSLLGFAPRIRKIDQFFERAREGRLPAVSWIDPNFADFGSSNDDHPPESDLYDGQVLVANVYNALLGAQNNAWSRTMLIVTYDEHGGFFDHVPPPPSGDSAPGFGRFGVRVPALIASPYIQAGTLDSVVRDHCSILKTLLVRFAPSQRLTGRVDRASDLAAVLNLDEPRADAQRIEIPPRPPKVSDEPVEMRAKAARAAAAQAPGEPRPGSLHEMVRAYKDELRQRRQGRPIP